MFDRVVIKSGYATLRVLIDDYELKKSRVAELLSEMKSRACEYEGGVVGDAQLFSIAVPPGANASEIIAVIDQGCLEDVWDAEVSDTGGRSDFDSMESGDHE